MVILFYTLDGNCHTNMYLRCFCKMGLLQDGMHTPFSSQSKYSVFPWFFRKIFACCQIVTIPNACNKLLFPKKRTDLISQCLIRSSASSCTTTRTILLRKTAYMADQTENKLAKEKCLTASSVSKQVK